MSRPGTCYLHISVENRQWREDYSEPTSDTLATLSIPLLGDTSDRAIRELVGAIQGLVETADEPKPSPVRPVS